jgi:uncharacterized protein
MTTRRPIPHTQDYFEVRRSAIQGLGAFALKRIRKGTRVIEYTGERVSHAVADSRYDDAAMKRHTTYLFVVSGRTVVDATVAGNEAKFINHSCDPNCESLIEGSRIYIEAIRTIQPGEELVYDYRFERTGDPDEEKRYRCRCGAATCRGTILMPEEPKRARKTAKGAKRVKGAAKKKKKATRGSS